ncbi:MAG TPA: CdaR family protein [Proteiniclasticum sp.]|nr:CdaR family protein [Proteiniclasticum sp.]
MAKQKGSDILLKAISLVLSFSLWIYIINVENPIKTMKVYNVPVRLENLENIGEQNLALLPNQDVMITLTVKGPASEVYRSVASNFRVVANLDDVALKAGANEVPIEITSYPSDIDVTPSSNVKAVIYLDDYLEREVSIVSQYDATAAEGHFIAGVTFNPSSATVKGPAEYVNRVTALAAKGGRGDLENNYKEIVSLVPIDENGNEVNHVIIAPLYVEVNVEVFRTKTVPLVIDTSGEIGAGFELQTNSIAPGEMLIAGPDNLLEQVNEIKTAEFNLASLTDTTDVILNLLIPNGIISINNGSTATVTFEVRAYETKTLSKNLSVLGLAEGLTAEFSSDTVEVVVSGPQSALEAVTEGNITVEIDLADLVAGEYKLKPVIGLPENIGQVSVTPEEITVTISNENEVPPGDVPPEEDPTDNETP